MWDIVQGYATEIFGDLFDPRKRVFWGYLASAWAISFLWLYFRRGESLSRAVAGFFAPQSWLTRSAAADFTTFSVNALLMLLISPLLLSQLTVAYLLFEWLHQAFDGRPVVAISPVVVAASFTLTLFLLDDIARYALHRALHRLPVLWAFHKVHHSATSLNPLTVFRTHPVEAILFSVRGALVQGVVIAPFIFVFESQVDLVTVMGASALTFAFNALGSNLRHSHVALGYWRPLERVLISPAQHQVHHSVAPRHVDRNFGATLAIWDWLFGTHCYSEPQETLTFGLRGPADAKIHGPVALYWRPVAEAFILAAGAVAKLFSNAADRFPDRSRRRRQPQTSIVS